MAWLPYLIIDTRNVETGIVSVTTLTDEDKPMRVATPVVIALAHLTVHRSQRIGLASLQVHHPEICIRLHNRKIASGCTVYTSAIFHHTTDEPRRNSYSSSDHSAAYPLFSKLPRSGIERNTYQRALHFRYSAGTRQASKYYNIRYCHLH